MTSKAITPERGEGGPPPGYDGGAGPSLMRQDEPLFGRVLGMVGAMLVIFGGAALVMNNYGYRAAVGSGWATFWLSLGLALLLFHAAYDPDVQFRRVYMSFGFLALVLGVFLCFLPYPKTYGDQFASGVLLLTLGLFFILAFLRHETDDWLRTFTQTVLGALGGAMALTGLIGGLISLKFLLPYGVVLGGLGLLFAASYVASRGTSDDVAYRAGQAIGVAGALAFVLALLRGLVFPGEAPPGGLPPAYLAPGGVLLLALGVVYVLVSLLLTSDNRFIVLTRRELGSFFYSPVAYLVLLGYTLAHWLAYFLYVLELMDRTVSEPMVRDFLRQLVPILAVIFAVPALTMRLLSEEKRSGTLEVLLTAPVNEAAVVLSKFLAAYILFLVQWVPFGLLLVALRIVGGQPFDYRPLLSFAVGLAVTGAGFMSLGLFFSSVTRNQIVSAVLSFTAMLILTMVIVARDIAGFLRPGSAWVTVLNHISFYNVWVETLRGRLEPRLLLFPASLTIFCLFVTVKVLEVRKWK
jgi:ABC-type transport system involved in multi-copper enzyme maturation permease subunit